MSDRKYPHGKYAVIKLEDVPQIRQCMGAGNARQFFDEKLIEDAVVIRRKDVFAAPALDAYANNIMVAVAVLIKFGVDREDPELKNLRELADFFFEEAELSRDTDTKVPD